MIVAQIDKIYWGYALDSTCYWEAKRSRRLKRDIMNLAGSPQRVTSYYVTTKHRSCDYCLLDQAIEKFAARR